MKPYTYFIHLGLLALTHWLLTCVLGTAGFVAQSLATHYGYLTLDGAFDQAWGAAQVAAYLSWPLAFALFFANLGILAAREPRRRAGRLLLALVVGGVLVTAGSTLLLGIVASLTGQSPSPLAALRIIWPWLLASFLAAGWLYRPWLRPAVGGGP